MSKLETLKYRPQEMYNNPGLYYCRVCRFTYRDLAHAHFDWSVQKDLGAFA